MSIPVPIDSTRDAIIEDGIVLCVRLAEGGAVDEACRAAMRGGLRVIELTLTTPEALDQIERLAKEETALVGGGTVLSPLEVRRVADAGGRFVFSPIFDPEVVDEAHRLGLLAVPGTATPTEILAAHRHGARLVKVFPSGALGGPDFVRAVRGPLPDVPLVPTSGPTAETLGDYLAAGAAAVGVGAEIFPAGLDPREIEAAACRVRAAFESARLGGPTPASGSRVSVSPLRLRDRLVQGVVCRWEGGQYVTLVAPGGMVACGIFDVAVCDRFGFAVAMAHGSPEHPLVEAEDVLEATIDTLSAAAEARGVKPGMTGREALERLLD